MARQAPEEGDAQRLAHAAGAGAQQALVAADERIRTTTDELAFAQAELGDVLTSDLKAALETAVKNINMQIETNHAANE